MNDTKKTSLFVVTALVMLAVSAWAYVATRPPKATDFERVGTPFFEAFTDAAQAKSLEVYAVDPQTLELRQFRVEFNNGVWRIPSHYDYPAEAADRLAATATSVMGLERESMVGRLKSDHERFGVVDPLDDEHRDPETAGQRLTLRDAAGDPLVDLIIGKEAGEVEANPEQMAFDEHIAQKYYYVRRPDENQTYKIRLDIDLSTRFTDWINPDLLQIETQDIRQIGIDNYTLSERQVDPLGPKELLKTQGDQLRLSRPDSFGLWQLEGLDAATEELDQARINSLARSLDELRIVGVRPKTTYNGQPLLTADLKLNRIPELEKNPERFRQWITDVQLELESYGFNLAPSENGSQDLQLVSTNGEMAIGTVLGTVYTLHFGKSVEGDERAIEVGGSRSKIDAESTEASGGEPSDDSEGSADSNDSDGDRAGDSAESDSSTPESDDSSAPIKNRYVMIRVHFDSALLGTEPTPPTEPEPPVKPEGYLPAPSKDDSPNAGEDGDQPGTTPDSDTESKDEQPQEPDSANEATRDPAFVEYDRLLAAYEEAKTSYELAKTRYEDEKKAWDEKVAKGQEKVDELNERFGEWFYVVSGDNLKNLQIARADIVKPKPEPESTDQETLPQPPNIDFDLPEAPADSSESPEPTPTETDGDGPADQKRETPNEAPSSDDPAGTGGGQA